MSRRARLAAASAVLCLGLVVPAAPPARAQTGTGVEWAPDLAFGEQFFPSYAIASAGMTFSANQDGVRRIGVDGGAVGVRVRVGPSIRTARMKLQVELPEIAEVSTYEFTLPGAMFVKDDENVYVFPPIAYRYRELLGIDQPFPMTARFRLYANGRPLGERTATLRVRAVSDCPFFTYRRYPASAQDMGWMFAAFVNENHPALMPVLNEALATGIVRQFTGHQMGQDDEVVRQMMALWVALARRGIVYSDITAPSAGTPSKLFHKEVFAQRVRFVGESLANTQANCVDGSVLLASLFRRIGLHALLTLRPDHCYLGARATDPKSAFHLETTLMGARPPESALPPERLDYYRGLVPADVFAANRAEILSFALALETGYRNYAEDAPLRRKREPGYTQVSVDAARDDWGVMPLSR